MDLPSKVLLARYFVVNEISIAFSQGIDVKTGEII